MTEIQTSAERTWVSQVTEPTSDKEICQRTRAAARSHTRASTHTDLTHRKTGDPGKGRESPSCSQFTMFLWRPLLAETNIKPVGKGDRVQFHRANHRSSLEVRGNNLITGTRDINTECCKYFPNMLVTFKNIYVWER